MGDDITIGVTEIVNNIEVTAQPNDQVIDISVIDNADEVTLNVTPTVVEVNVNRGSSYARWGTIYGTLGDQTDLANALLLKADLVGGLVPAYQLPSFVDDVIEVANYAALPTVGETGKIYLTLDNNKIYRWSGSVYVEIASNQAIWGSITGTLSAQTDLQTALDTKALKATTISTNSPLSGGGDLSANRTLSISQSNTSTDGYLSSTDWNTFNNKVPTARTLTINGTTYDLSANRSWTISGATWGSITGTLSSQTDLQSALDAKVPTARTLTINGTTYDLSANRSWTISGLPSMVEYNETDKTFWNNGKGNIQSNTTFGEESLKNNTSGGFNAAFGFQSLLSNTSGGGNTAISTYALTSNTSGYNNVAVGYSSLLSNTTGYYNTSVGFESMANNSIGTSNTAFGHSSLYSNNGNDNTAIGYYALGGNTSGGQNTSVGMYAGFKIADGSTNNSTSSQNVFLGSFTKASANGVSNEIAIGYNTIGNGTNSVTLGNTSITKTILRGNVGIGTTNPASTLTIASSVGDGLEFNATNRIGTSGGTFFLSYNRTTANYLTLEYDALYHSFRTSNTERMRITSGGNVGIGTTNPTRTLDVRGLIQSKVSGGTAGFLLDSDIDNSQFYFAKNGTLKWACGTNTGAGGANDYAFYTYGGSMTSFILYSNGNYQFFGSNVSDIRAKEKIENLDFNATEKIMALQPKSYYMKNDDKKLKYGFIAQDVYKVLPDLISGDLEDEGFVGLDYNGIIPILVQSIQELKAEIELLKQK